MADQTIEIKLILRDEISKGLAPIEAELRKLQQIRLDATHAGMQRLGAATGFVRRELGSLGRLTFGGIIGGGVVASIVGITKALGDLAQEGLRLRYTAQQLGVRHEWLQNLTDGLSALGMSGEEAAGSLKSALSSLRDAETFGRDSSLYKTLEKGVRGSGIRLWNEIRSIMAGPEGAEGALQHLFRRMKTMDPTGQRELLKSLNLSSLAVADLERILPQLHKRIQLTQPEMERLNIANQNFKIEMSNIGLMLGSAVMPGIEKVTTALANFLKTEAGKKFTGELRDWTNKIADAISGWILDKGPNGLEASIEQFKKDVEQLKKDFEAADKVIKGLGGWTPILAAVVATGFLAWLTGVAAKLVLMGPILLALKDVLPHIGKSPEQLKEEIDAETKRKRESGEPTTIPEWLKQGGWDWLREQFEKLKQMRPGLQPQSGEGKPQTEQERRAALHEDEMERDRLNQELKVLAAETGQLADYLQIGGPEGKADGTSGYGAGLGGDLSRESYNNMFKSGPMAGQYDRVVLAASQQDVSPSLLAGIMALESKAPQGGPFGMSRPTLSFLNPGGLMMGKGMKQFMSFPTIGEGIDKTAATVARNLQRGGGTFEGLAEQYSPSKDPKTGRPYQNDPGGTNRLWPSLVSKFTSQLTERGYDPGGLQGAVPGGGGSGWDETGMSGITQTLAGRNAAVNGSATIDIDVGGLGQSGRDPDSLFRPQSLDGAIQMQNATQPAHNPLSFQ